RPSFRYTDSPGVHQTLLRSVAHAAGRHPETMKMTPHPPSYLGHPLPPWGEGGPAVRERVRGFFQNRPSVGVGAVWWLVQYGRGCVTSVTTRTSRQTESRTRHFRIDSAEWSRRQDRR